MKIDKRRNYYLVIDTETANTIGQPLAYDIGFAIMDTQGRIYKKWSYVTQEIFFDEKKIYGNPKMMNSAYYHEKLPRYYKGIFETKEWECKSIYYIRKVVENACKEFNVKGICAYNVNFDTKALRNTIRYITKSETAEFFPTDIEIIDIWTLACNSIAMRDEYLKFCLENHLYSEANNCKTSAETVWAYLNNNAEFEESHTGLADVLIECGILAECLKKRNLDKTIVAMPWKIPQDAFKKLLGEALDFPQEI